MKGGKRNGVGWFVTVPLLCLAAASCVTTGTGQSPRENVPPGEQGIRGTLFFEGEPLDEAYVYAYRSYATNLLGPADFASAPSGRNGAYSIELVPGSYYLVARKRVSGENTGPVAAGDLYSVHPANPVTVSDGRYTLADLNLIRMRDPMFFRSMSRQMTGTGIRGTIVDAGGKPVPWVFAMAYTSADMKRIPEYTSVMTGEDGRFTVYLPRGGTYWLAARKSIRERPVSGEPYGLYRGTPDHSIAVPEGAFVEGVTIRLESFRRGIQD